MAEKSRLVFIDLLRGWAVLVMVEVHVFNAFMIPAYRETQWFEILNFINGLVAPSFIFISGFVFVVASQRKLESFRTFGSDFWRQIWRIGLVMIIGYYLHLPFFSLRRMLTETTESGWLQFYQTDVLQCIAVGLFILFMVRIFIRNNRWYKHALLFSGLFVCGLSPFLSDIDFVRFIHPSIAAYINGRHFSLFPLFPWMGFMLFAGYCAANYIEARRDNRERKFIIRMAAAGFLMLSAGLVPALWQYEILGRFSDIRSNPFFFFERLGIVILCLALCWWYAGWRKTSSSFILPLSRQSLLAYTAHLIVIYGQWWRERSLWYYYGHLFTPLMCCLWTALLLGAVILVSSLWDWLKRDHLPLAQTIFGVVAVTTAVIFISR
ncbi:MAG: heparan-alpha-glucosaminide N-acetyltransferase domain-containing protein [Bacteroidota bacterium]